MKSELLSISKIFTECLFRIPDYQRGYSWTDKQLRDFWNDVEQLQSGKNHYTGVLTLEEVPEQDYKRWDDDLWIIESRQYTPYYVVDGQQRLTTIVILLQAILEHVGEQEKLNYTAREEIRKKFIFESKDGGISRSYLFGYEKDNPSYEFLKTKILLEPSDNHSTAEETIYTHNLAAAKKVFQEKLEKLTVLQLEILYTKVTQRLLFNIYTISNEIDVFVAFETMNNRGKPLSHLELLKNRLIYLSTKFEVESSEREKLRRVINDSWKTIYHYLGKNKDRPLSDDFFLQTHFLIYFGPQVLKKEEDGTYSGEWDFLNDDSYKDYLLENIFTARRMLESGEETQAPISIQSIYKYAHSIKEAVQVYYRTLNAHDSDFPDEERVVLEQLWRLGDRVSIPLQLVLQMREPSSTERVKFLNTLERTIFVRKLRVHIPGLENLNALSLAIRILKDEITVAKALDVIEAHFEERVRATNFTKILIEWTKNSASYYGWKSIKYFMFEYELELLKNSRTSREKLNWGEFSRENFEEDYSTIEHIYPQKVSDECWRTAFNVYPVRQRNLLRHSLGNLLPLSKPKNSSLRNKCFTEKVGNDESTVGYKYGCYSEIEVSQAPDWTPEEILTRGVRLLNFMERRWGVRIGDERNKVRALGLEFLRPKP